MIGSSYYQSQKKVEYQYIVYEKPISPIPVATTSLSNSLLQVGAGSYYVLDVESGVVLASQNAETLFFPASTAKMMTAITARKLYKLDQPILIAAAMTGIGERVTFVPGSTFSTLDLIKASLIQSNNAAALALAAADPAGMPHFIQEMNLMATRLNLTKTRFDNPVGFDSEYMQSTAKDLSFLARELIKDQVLKKIVATKQTTITEISTNKSYPLYNTNDLLGYNNQVIGLKTGTTDLAGQVLVTLVTIEGHEVIITVLDSADRYHDTKQILEWLNSSVDWYNPQQLSMLET